MGRKFFKRFLSNCNSLQWKKGCKKIICLLILLSCGKIFADFEIMRNGNNLIGISTGKTIDLLSFVSCFGMFKMSDFIFYSSGRYYFPEQIEIFTGDDIAYQKIGEGSIERYSVELKVCYGKGLRFGGSCKLEYYSLRFLGIEFFENLFSCFTLIEFPFGLLYGEYFSNNEWQCGYFYELCIAKLRNGFEISTFSVKDSLAFKFKSYLATFGRDLTFSISYIHSLNIKNAYPFELTVSKFYENFEIAFNFLPSDVVDSSFKVVLSYYF